MTRKLPLVLFVLVLSAARPAAVSGDPAPADGTLTLSTERVVVFKDGYALFVKAGTATADADGRVSTTAVPDSAVLGCVWATGDDRKVLGMSSAWEEKKSTRERETPCLTTLDILRANVGSQVTFELTREGAANVSGILQEVLEAPVPPPPDVPPPSAGPAGTTITETPRLGGQLVVVAHGQGGPRISVPVAEIRTVTGAPLTTTIKRTEEVVVRAKRLSIEMGKAAAGKAVKIRLLYFAEGIRWIPTYRVGGELVKDAEIALQGEVVNAAEPLVQTALDLVVGVPSFRFKDVASPLTLESAMRGALRQAAPQLAQQMASNTWSNNSGGLSFLEEGRGEGTFEGAPELATEANQDLFVYGVGKVSLAKGERATYPLWQSTAPLRHLYTMDVQVLRNFQSGEHSYSSSKAQWEPSATRPGTRRSASQSPVWHELELTNASPVPWTTGAALVLRGDVPLGQDILTYTAPGASSLLPMTVAVDLQGKWTELEVERKSNALDWSHTTYSLVRKKGSVTLVSHRKEASPVRVSVSVGGRVESATENGRVTINDLRAQDWEGGTFAVNNHSDVVWDLTLAPGETKTLEVVFSFYVR